MSFNSFDLVELQDDQRSTIEVMRVGQWDHPIRGAIEISRDDLKQFKENFDNDVRRVEPAVDQEHKDEEGAAGWIKELSLENNRLMADVEWNELGVELIEDERYRYISPTFKFEWTDPETNETHENVLVGAALTNRPFIKDMSPVSLSEDFEQHIIEKLTDLNQLQEFKEQSDDPNNPGSHSGNDEPNEHDQSITLQEVFDMEYEFSEDILELFEVDSADELEADEVEVRLEEVIELREQVNAIEGLVELDEDESLIDGIERLQSRAAELSEKQEEVVELRERVDNLEEKDQEREKEIFFDEMIEQGKLKPAEREHYEQMWDENEEHVRNLLDDRAEFSEYNPEDQGTSESNSEQPDDDDLVNQADQNAVERIESSDSLEMSEDYRSVYKEELNKLKSD